MQQSEKQLTEARDTVQTLLEQLGLATYLFEVEPRTNHWEVHIECAPDSAAQGRASAAGGRMPKAAGWQSSVLNVDPDLLTACRTDRAARDKLLDVWRQRLRA